VGDDQKLEVALHPVALSKSTKFIPLNINKVHTKELFFYSMSELPRLMMLLESRLVVGSSSARIPQLALKVSASAILITSDANIWKLSQQ